MHLHDARFCAIDLETTGLDAKRDEIIAFACIPIHGMKILVGDARYTLIRPNSYRLKTMKYHGISPKDLEAAPTFEKAAPSVLEALDGILVGYCVEFDYQLLKRGFKETGVKLKRDTIDIMKVEHWLGLKSRKGATDLSFESIMEHYGLKETHRHHALADAFFVAQIFQYQIARLSQCGVDSTSRLRKILKRLRYAIW